VSAIAVASPRVAPRETKPTTVTQKSSSMEPTIRAGETLKVDTSAKCCHRGDIVAFISPKAAKKSPHGAYFLYRVIALPGETITGCAEQHVCIDGVQLTERYLRKETGTSMSTMLPNANLDPNGPAQLVCEPTSPEGGCTVPSGKVFVMGDNRSNSRDSRVEGPVRISWIVGTVHPSSK
jgi:signal peptidase I